MCVCDVEKCAKRYMYANQFETLNHAYADVHVEPLKALLITAVRTKCDSNIQPPSSQFRLRNTSRGCSA